jgi:AcrR family transcriptional regulator
MGNREALLEGATRCLREKGYARTTARDIATASGVSLAAIGYHFGSKDALLEEAFLAATGTEIGDQLETALAAADPGSTPSERFARAWDRMLAAFPERRWLLVASLEHLTHVSDAPDIRQRFATAVQPVVSELAGLLADLDDLDEQSARAVGSFYFTMLNGLVIRWLIDPESAPSGAEVALALRALTGR